MTKNQPQKLNSALSFVLFKKKGIRTFTRSEILNAEALNEGKKDPDAPFLMIIDNKVYDVREFVPDHPGGSVILTHVGKDGTGEYLLCL